ncbi:unnamed protein product [Symbiodinium natans]|uniref:BRCT domain-containing protein n=1 Tax=Symbiodinium natans TaxID=878477 RepID=A0A812HPP6_9DINO|nr:unnamed protein product [Symbiodinium natans]
MSVRKSLTAPLLRLMVGDVLAVVVVADGPLVVLHNFETEELTMLKQRGKSVVGVPFVERLLRERSLLDKVWALPLYDLIYRSEKGLCFSAMTPQHRCRCQDIATWVGARVTEEVTPATELLVAQKVSLRPDSKYQMALNLRLPIVRPSYLEALWSQQRLVDKETHFLPPLAGLAINLGPVQDQVSPELRRRAEAAGATITTLDKAEIIIVTDASKPIYKEGRNLGMLLAPPRWLERCLQIGCCLEIAGELEVPQAGVPMGGSLLSVEAEISPILADCVLCLVYLPPGRARDQALHMAYRCGAMTTLEPNDSQVTHVLFNVVPGVLVNVSVRVDEEDDRVQLVDVRWLEACVDTGKRASEQGFPRPRVTYNPSCDAAYSAALQPDSSTPSAGEARRVEGGAALEDVSAKSTQLVEAPAQPGPLDGPPLSGLTIRITGLDGSWQGSRERQRLQEMVQTLGAKVADQTSRLADITHIACVVPERLEAGLAEKAKKRQIHLVTAQWLLDCNRRGSRQPEARYNVRDAAPAASPSLSLEDEALAKASSCVGATVLAKCDILVSPWALGLQPKLMQMAKELGATSVRAFRNVEDLRALLQAKAEGQAWVVVVEKEEARQGSLEGCAETWTPELRSIFVQPSWLSETYSQRRRLALSSFAAFSGEEDSGSLPRVAPEAAYAFQPAEMKRMEEEAAQAHAREVQSKAQQRVSQGLRLADLGC